MRTCAPWYFSAPTMICAMASTTLLGCLPAAVSAESITASAAVHHGIGDVRHFGAGRNGVHDHRFHHLRGDDDHAVLVARLLDDLLLQSGELRIAHLDAEIAAGHHDGIARPHHLGQILDRLGAFDLGHQQRVAARRAQQRARLVHVGGIAREGHREISRP